MDRGILMKPDLIRQTMDGNKTETRRLRGLKEINRTPSMYSVVETGERTELWTMHRSHGEPLVGEVKIKCPYGVVGDRLYIKEPHYRYGNWRRKAKTRTGRPGWEFVSLPGEEDMVTFTEPENVLRGMTKAFGWYKRSPLFMEKQHARIWLEITGIKVHRIQDITEEEAKTEGVAPDVYDEVVGEGRIREIPCYLPRFIELWDKINPDYPWGLSPWVWVVQWKLISGS